MKIEFEAPTEIVLILDRSGSMASVVRETIDGANEFIGKQKAEPGEASLTLVLFDDQYEVLYTKPIADCEPIDDKTFVPRGMTALLDAVGKTVNTMLSEKKVPEKAIFCIITDGQENASKEYNGEQIKKLVAECEKKHGWQFIYLGANVDAFAEAQKIGIPQARAANIAADGIGTRAAYAASGQMVSSYRGGGRSALRNFELQNLVDNRTQDEKDDDADGSD